MMDTDTNKLPRGLWPVMLTPFSQTNQVDHDQLRALTDFYLAHGARGLFANCLSSEMFQLTDEERLSVVATVARQAGSRAPVVASGTFSSDIPRCSDFIRRVHDAGAAAVVVITNQLARADQNEDHLKRNCEAIMKATGTIPLGVYECPVPYKRLLSPELMRWLGSSGRFFYHKDTSCDITAIRPKLAAVRGTSLALYNANTATALASLEAGAAGISPIGANFYPELYTYLITEFDRNGATPRLARLNAQLDVMDTIVDRHYPHSAKWFLKARGLNISTASRVPSGAMTVEDRMKLDSLVEIFTQAAETYLEREKV